MKRLTATILSMSLLTVMAGAAVAPALEQIRLHFADAPDLLIQLVISLPALFIILTSLLFGSLSRVMRTRTIACIGLGLYIAAGSGCFFINHIVLLLVMRALLGVSVGLIMPLSTGLLAYYFPPEEQAHLMGLSAAMNQMGGVVGTLIAGLLAGIAWNYAFLIYALALVALLMVVAWLPNDRLDSAPQSRGLLDFRPVRQYHSLIAGMFLLTVVFFIFPTNFAMITARRFGWSTHSITAVMVGLDLVAFFAGLVFGTLMKRYAAVLRFFPPVAITAGFALYAYANGMSMLLLGSALIGMANGVGVPYYFTKAGLHAGKSAATTVMPWLSAALYAGQFLSPLIIQPLGRRLFPADITAAYKAGILIAVLYFMQTVLVESRKSIPHPSPPLKGGRKELRAES